MVVTATRFARQERGCGSPSRLSGRSHRWLPTQHYPCRLRSGCRRSRRRSYNLRNRRRNRCLTPPRCPPGVGDSPGTEKIAAVCCVSHDVAIAIYRPTTPVAFEAYVVAIAVVRIISRIVAEIDACLRCPHRLRLCCLRSFGCRPLRLCCHGLRSEHCRALAVQITRCNHPARRLPLPQCRPRLRPELPIRFTHVESCRRQPRLQQHTRRCVEAQPVFDHLLRRLRCGGIATPLGGRYAACAVRIGTGRRRQRERAIDGRAAFPLRIGTAPVRGCDQRHRKRHAQYPRGRRSR